MSTYSVDIKAPRAEVWQALTDADLIELSDESDRTHLELTQEPGEGAEWDAILTGLKELVEAG
jgi:hypothetical protein